MKQNKNRIQHGLSFLAVLLVFTCSLLFASAIEYEIRRGTRSPDFEPPFSSYEEPEPPAKPICLSKLEQTLVALMEAKIPTAYFGIMLQPLLSNETLFAYNERKFFTPASSNKLLTSAVALIQLGLRTQFSTAYAMNGNLSSMCVLPRGDPSMNAARLEFDLQDLCNNFDCSSLKSIQVDPTYFTDTTAYDFPVSWMFEDLAAGYGAPPTSEMINVNNVQVKISPGANVGDPFILENLAPYFFINMTCEDCYTMPEGADGAEMLEAVYDARNMDTVQFIGRMKKGSPPQVMDIAVRKTSEFFVETLKHVMPRKVKANLRNEVAITPHCNAKDFSQWKTIYTSYSPYLMQLLNHTLQESDNTYMEVIAKHLGLTQPTPFPTKNINDMGIAVIRNVLINRLGVDPHGFRQFDASGVSVKNLVSPKAFTELLQNIYKLGKDVGPTFRRLLPVAGKSGTLKNRFKKFPGILQAKTGTLTGIHALSGYVNNDNFPNNNNTLVFTILVNHAEPAASVVREVIDQIAVWFSYLLPNC